MNCNARARQSHITCANGKQLFSACRDQLLKTTAAQAVKTPVINCLSQDCTDSPGFKPFNLKQFFALPRSYCGG